MPNEATVRARGRIAIFVVSFSVLALSVLVASASAASETAGDTFAVSDTPAGAFAEAGVHQRVSISDDGRYVAFESGAENLIGSPSGLSQVYVKDLDSGQVLLASRADGEEGEPAGEPPFGRAWVVDHAAISGNGRYVIFDSASDNLVEGLPLDEETQEEWPSTHVYRRDLLSGETALVDRVTGLDGATVGRGAVASAISGNGRYVVFTAEVADLDDPGGEHEWSPSTAYVRDMQAGTTTIVSRASGADGPLADGPAFGGAVAPDDRYVAFESSADNLVPDMGSNSARQVYLRELQPPFETILVSQGADGPGNEGSYEPTFVGGEDCRVGFASQATNLGAAESPLLGVYLRDLCSAPGSTTLVSLDEEGEPFEEATLAGATDDGRIAFEGSGPWHLYLRDLSAGETTLVDRAAGAEGEPADSRVEWGAISANGCRAAFTTEAHNLSAEAPPPGTLQAYVRQLAACKTPEVPVVVPGAGKPSSGNSSPGPASPTHLRIVRLGPRRLVLEFSGPGIAAVKIKRLVTEPRRHWKQVTKLLVQVEEAGRTRTEMPQLGPGRYRIGAHLRGSQGQPLVRLLTIGTPR